MCNVDCVMCNVKANQISCARYQDTPLPHTSQAASVTRRPIDINIVFIGFLR